MTSPIDRLPEELVVAVFELAIEGDVRTYPGRRAMLALARRGWRDVIQHTPFFWSKISEQYSLPLTILCLKRSRTFPLDITFAFNGFRRPLSPAQAASFREICRHISRWRTAVIGFGARHHAELVELLVAPAPLLERVEIELWSREPLKAQFNLFAGQARRLKSVQLTKMCVRWSPAMFSNLVVLELEGRRQPFQTVENILATLVSSPHLNTLRLNNIRFNRDALDTIEHPAIHLPHLLHLDLSELNHHSISFFLRHIQTPPCQRLKLGFLCDRTTDTPALLQLIRPLLPRTTIPEGTSKIDVNSMYFDFSIDFPTSSPYDLDLAFDQLFHIPIIHDLFSILPEPFLQTETKFILRAGYPPEEIEAILATAERAHVTALTVDLLAPQSTSIVLNRLADRPWIFPALHTLTIDIGNAAPSTLARMIKARYGIEPRAEQTDRLPPRLSKLSVFGSSPRHQTDQVELEALIGWDVMTWSDVPVPSDSD